jgi:hypothetical protein
MADLFRGSFIGDDAEHDAKENGERVCVYFVEERSFIPFH